MAHGPARAVPDRLLTAAARLAGAGNLTPVTAEGELLEEVGDGLAHGQEFNFHVAVRADIGDPPGQAQGLSHAIAQPDLGESLLTPLRQGTAATPHRTQGIESN